MPANPTPGANLPMEIGPTSGDLVQVRPNNAYDGTESVFWVDAKATLNFNNQAQNGGTAKVIGNWNGSSTVSHGVSVEVASYDATGLQAAVTSTTLAMVPADNQGFYRVNWTALVTRVDASGSTLGGSNGLQVTYTPGDSIGTTALGGTIGYSGNNTNTLGTVSSGTIIFYAQANTPISFVFGYAANSMGAMGMQYSLHLRLEDL